MNSKPPPKQTIKTSPFKVRDVWRSFVDFFSKEVVAIPKLPLEIEMQIISKMDSKTLNNVPLVCRAWKTISVDQNVWRNQMQRAYGIPSEQINTSLSAAGWRQLVKKTYFKYIRLSDAEKLRLALENGHFVLAKNLVLTTPSLLTNIVLYDASCYGHLLIVKLAIQRGADVNYHAKFDGSTPLYIAAQGGHLEVAQLLVSHGAKIEERFVDEYTPLYIASQNGKLGVVKYLLSVGAQVSASCSNGSTPLYIASQQGRLNVVQALVNANASAAILHKNFSCLYVAARNGHDKILAFLLDRFHDMIEVRGGDGSSALYVASQNGHVKCVTALTIALANTETIFSSGYRSLYVAAQNGHADVVEALCCAGASVDAYNESSVALYVACQNGHIECVESLLIHGASVNLVNANHYTALYVAASKNRLAICKLLLDYGAQVDAVHDLLGTPLYVAAGKGHIEIVNLLLSRGASPNGIVNSNKIPLHIAMKGEFMPIVTILVQAGADLTGLENVDCDESTLDYVQMLVAGVVE